MKTWNYLLLTAVLLLTACSAKEKEPEIIKYTVTIEQPEGGTITVKQGNTVIENGTEIIKGTSLTVTATPDEFYTLESVNVSSPFELTQDTTITAVFEPMVMYTVTIEQNEQGTITVLNKGNVVNSGDQVPENTELSVIAFGNNSHVFSNINTTPYLVLTQDTTITASFEAIDEQEKYIIGSYNIRYYTTGDTGGKSWNNRKQLVFNLINKYNYDVCGIQETTNTQAVDFLSQLSEYTYIGYGRNNGKEYTDGGTGEQTALIYKTSRFNELAKGRFFLSNTPEVPSKLSDSTFTSTFNRMVVWVQLEDKQTQKVFFLFSTHFDHPTTQKGIDTRKQQATIAKAQILALTEGYPVIFTGDFNCEPTEPAYTILSGEWHDAYETTPTLRQGGYINKEHTYTGLYSSNDKASKRIDYVFTNDKVDIKSYIAADEKLAHTTYPSDHLPILIECSIQDAVDTE